jgi:aminoglycoside phosphotransferase family enzyme/predicted kinase
VEGDPNRILAALREPARYPHPADRVELIETHISQVFLAGDYAYKIKKPVALGFLDFSTLEKRRFYCEEELRLNRRTAPGLYLGVVPIAEGSGGLRVDGPGKAVEYAVQMRRFPQEVLADAMARRGGLRTAQIEAIAAALAAFHSAIPAARDREYGSPERVAAPALANFEQLSGLVAYAGEKEKLGEVRAWTLAEGARLRETFAARRRGGFVRECHGDLHLGNIAFLEGRPVLFDCIEFDPELRWIDVMNEVAFLAMDLLEHGLAAAAWRFLNAYLETTGDYAGVRVLRYYLVYRAVVRAKIACIRSQQPGAGDAAQGRAHREFGEYLALAGSLIASGRRAIVVMHGLSGSGKTTVAQKMSESLGAVRVRSDVERKRLHGLAAGARTQAEAFAGLYSPEGTRLTYERLAQVARDVVESGYGVIVDAAFLRRAEREEFRALARELGTPFVIASCQASEATLRDRVARREAARSDASEAGVSVLEKQLATQEALGADELADAAFVGTEGSEAGPEEAIGTIASRIEVAGAGHG